MSSQKAFYLQRPLFKYSVVGLFNSILTLSVIYLVKVFQILGDVEANMLGYALGFMASFTLNRRWTFNYNGCVKSALLKYILVFSIAYFANLLTVLVSIHYLNVDSYISHAIGMLFYAIVGYTGSRLFVFGSKY